MCYANQVLGPASCLWSGGVRHMLPSSVRPEAAKARIQAVAPLGLSTEWTQFERLRQEMAYASSLDQPTQLVHYNVLQ